MRRYTVFTTREFDRDFSKLSPSFQGQIGKEIDHLETNPYVGKPLGFPFFREKKAGKFRVYYLIYDEYVVVFIIALNDKKTQEDAIQKIRHLLPAYRAELERQLKGASKA